MAGFNQQLDKRNAALAAGLVAYATGLSAEDILSNRRGRAEVSFARQMAMYLTYVRCGMSLARVALAFVRDRSTVAHACHQIEDRREDPNFDQWIEMLEEALSFAMRVRTDLSAPFAQPGLAA